MISQAKALVLLSLFIFVQAFTACKSTNQNSKSLAAESNESTAREDQANALAAEYRQAFAQLESDWSPADASGMALDNTENKSAKTAKTTVKPTQFADVTAKLKSVNGHLQFIAAELKNPNSEYHNGLKAKKIIVDANFEKQLLVMLSNARTYVGDATRTSAATEAYAKSWGITRLSYLPSALSAQVYDSYQLIDQWDQQLYAIELAINAKEKLNETSDSIRSFFSSLKK